MAIRRQHRFGGINTDLSPTILDAGTADVALNVEIHDLTLRKRSGFSEYEEDVDGSGNAILSAFVAHFANGEVHLLVKLDTGLIYSREVHPTPAASFSNISLSALGYTSNRHSLTDKGWWFIDADRVYYFDSVGGTKILPNMSVKKAGLPKPATAPAISAIAGGRKDGRYHVNYAYRNSLTDDIGVVSESQTPGVECRIDDDTGGIQVTNYTTINAAAYADNVKYEWDQFYFYSTLGDTEYLGLGTGEECWSHRGYIDTVKDATHLGNGSAAMFRADHVQAQEDLYTNSGGEPPAAQVGCYTGSRGVYGRIYDSGTLVEEKIMFSIPGHPLSVPQRVQYDLATVNDAKSFDPKPWFGDVRTGWAGNMTAMEFGGGIVGAYTENQTYTLNIDGNGRFYPVMRNPSKGCAGIGASVGTPSGIHALGDSWTILSAGSWKDLSHLKFETSLDEIPAAHKGKARMAYYGYREQIWCAVVKSGGTVAQRILIWDETINELTMFDIASTKLNGAGINDMVELVQPGAKPTMLVCLDDGRILKYPDGVSDDGTHFACEWRGYFGQEGVGFDQRLRSARLITGANCSGNVSTGLRAMRAPDQTVTQNTVLISQDNDLDQIDVNYDAVDGNFFQLSIVSANTVTTQWEIKDFILVLERT